MKLIKKIFYFIKHKLGYSAFLSGTYNTWDDAKKNSDGYDSKEIFNKLVKTYDVLQTRKDFYEQDTVLTSTPRKPIELIKQINLISKKYNELLIIDYGGSLGNVFRNNKKDFPKNISWNIVEQEHIVEYGQNLKINNINFFNNFEDIPNISKHHIVLFSSSLQYLENPYTLLDKILRIRIPYVFFDLTPFHLLDDEIKIQNFFSM